MQELLQRGGLEQLAAFAAVALPLVPVRSEAPLAGTGVSRAPAPSR